MAEGPSPDRDWIAAAASFFVAKDRAKRFAFRIRETARERATSYAGERVGMTSFARAGPVLETIAADVATTAADVLAGRLRDRERGETEIPLVVALESVRERVDRAAEAEALRLDRRVPAEWAQARLRSLLDDAAARLDAFAEVYEAKRMVPPPEPVDVDRLLARVEADAAGPTDRGPHADRPAPRIVTAGTALDDCLRAARAELPTARRPWRVARDGAGRLSLSLGAPVRADAAGAPSPRAGSPAAPPPMGRAAAARERTDRAAEVLSLVQGVAVSRAEGPDGETTGVLVALADLQGEAVGERVAAEGDLAPAVDAAVRAYLLEAAKRPDPMDPARLVGVLGVFRAIEQETERVLAPHLRGSAVRYVAARAPRESSRKAPLDRRVVAALADLAPGFPTHRADDVLAALAAGKASAKTAHPPDAAVVLATTGRAGTGATAFAERVLPLDPLSADDVTALVRDLSTLSILRVALERGRDPGPGWDGSFEEAAFGTLRRLARVGRLPGA